MSRHVQLLVALLLGGVTGALLHGHSELSGVAAFELHLLRPLGQLFLRLLFMVVVPMVFSALVLGVLELAQGRGLGKVAARTLLWTVVTSSVSVFIGVALVAVLEPGAGFTLESVQVDAQRAAVEGLQRNAAAALSPGQALVELLPKNPLDTATRALSGDMLPFMVFALLFGAALGLGGSDSGAKRVSEVLREVYAASMTIVGWAMRLAPLGVFAIVFGTMYQHGAGLVGSLLRYIGVVLLGLLIQQFVVYSLVLRYGARRSPLQFFRAIRDVMTTAFATSSSNATLPQSLETAEARLGLRPEVSRFVLTVGATANQNGTALFEGITVLFLAQVYGIQLGAAEQVQVVVMSIVTGIGTAGVPGGSMPLILLLLQQVGVPPEGLGIVLGVDRFLDMCRTTVNVTGDLVIASAVDDA